MKRIPCLYPILAFTFALLSCVSVHAQRQMENSGVAADGADPDDDGHSNQEEFENGTDPLDEASH